MTQRTDAEAKDLVRSWPVRPTTIWELPYGEASWFRAQPRMPSSRVACPRLSPPRADRLLTSPDGMWVNLAQRGLADIFCIDVCGTLQNLNDKRSRYFVVASSLVLRIDREWLLEKIPTRGGGSEQRYRILGRKKPTGKEWHLPVRHLRVLFSLPNKHYRTFGRNGVAAGHEYFCAHSSLGSITSQKMREFLRAMAPKQHFLTYP